MPQVRVTKPAGNCGSNHSETGIRRFDDILLRDRRPKAWPAGSRLELRIRAKYSRITTDAAEYAFLMLIQQCTRKGPLSIAVPSDFE